MVSNPVKPGTFGPPPPGLDSLAFTEEYTKRLLTEYQDAERRLRECAPSDPMRTALLTEKARTLGDYQASKARLKDLRREANGSTPRAAQAAASAHYPPPPGFPPLVAHDALQPPRGGAASPSDGLRSVEVLRKLYGALTGALERDALETLTDAENESITAFLEWWEDAT